MTWRIHNKREEKKEAARKAALIERGFGPVDRDLEKGKAVEDSNGVGGGRQ